MHHIALNAQIQAILLGTGTGLEVLAAKTVSVSVETTTFSDDALTKLNDLAASLTEVTRECAGLSASGLEHRQILDGQGKTVEQELHGLRNRSLEALSSVTRHAGAIQSSANEILEQGRPDENVVERFEATNRFIGETRQLIDVLPAELRQPAETEDRESWKTKYTMESEREVHAAVLEGRTPALAATQLTQENADSTELFGDPTSQTVESSPAPVNSPAVLSKSAEAPVLGENIELF